MKTQIKLTKSLIIMCGLLFATILISWQTTQRNQDKQQDNHWEAPKSADTIKNPLASNVYQTQIGKKLFEKQCVSCHGVEGKGNGQFAPSLNPKPADLTSKQTQSHTDGALYWKIMTGMSPMPSYEYAHKLDHNQCWQLINYIRELGKKQTTK